MEYRLPHHFAFDRGEKEYPWGVWDPKFYRFVEVFSNHGTSECQGNDKPLHTTDPDKTMQAGLEQGHRFGVIGSSDTHVSRPGRSNWMKYRGGMVAFLAKELTREAIWDALWNYRVYAMAFDRIYVDFRINDQIMGSEVACDGKCHVACEVVGRDEEIDVVLLRNNKVYRRETGSSGLVAMEFDDEPPTGTTHYYLRVTQKNGERAWSTPIWVARV